MSEDEVEGERKQAEGRAQEKKGEITGDTSEELKGKGKKVVGKAQEEWGEAKD